MDSADYIDLEKRFGAHNYEPLGVVLQRGQGCWVWDVDGNRYLDCLAAYSAVNQGHCHPRLVRALQTQAANLTLTSRAFYNDQLGPLCRELCELAGYRRMLPMNTGAEAVETAIKAARKWAYTVKGVPEDQAEILVFDGNFHGRTTTVVGFSSERQYRQHFGPFAPGFKLLPYGDAEAVRQAMHEHVAAVLIEPIQGEAGIVLPPPGYLREVAVLCQKSRALLMLDEIQSGLGRTGRMFAYEHEGARPDVLILGKALSGGMYPVSAVLADDEVMDVFRPGDHGSTYGGNPLGAAVAREALRVLTEEGLVDNSAALGAVAMERLQGLHSPYVKEVRGRGLWIGIELHPEAGGARRFCEELGRRGLLCKETHTHVIRFAPPLTISRDELEWALERLEAVLTGTVVEPAGGSR